MNLTFAELLAHQDAEFSKWEAWLLEHGDAVLAFPLRNEQIPDLKSLLQHIVGVQLYFAELLAGKPITEWWKQPPADRDGLVRMGRASLSMLRAQADAEQDWNRMVRVGEGEKGMQVSARKAFAQVLTHSMWHWAQVALLARMNGVAPPGKHDLILSNVLQ
ncbi:MAG: hypothetical protein K2X35_15975 [Bryobacteraceae bacterium]|nr:hypothetical protein [Bryobacteraceae bacterium]